MPQNLLLLLRKIDIITNLMIKSWYLHLVLSVHSELSTDRYHRLADQYLEHIVEKLEAIGDETDLPGYDIEYNVRMKSF
jgi:hypothetical protein